MKFLFSLLVALYFLIYVSISFAEKGYPEQVQPVEIKSSADGVLQNALYFSPKVDYEVPLLVALHTWSSDWENTHNVPLAEGSIERGWAFIHPDFRGPNREFILRPKNLPPNIYPLTLPTPEYYPLTSFPASNASL